jgi:hypothetical protein
MMSQVAMENVFDSISEALMPEYVRRGHRNLAVRIADNRMGSMGAPVIEIIRAIENPGGDNRAGYARLRDWEKQNRSGITIAQALPMSWLFFDVWDEIAKDPALYSFLVWHPDSGDFLNSDVFKSVVRESGVLAYWQAQGYPPHCKPVGDDDFECTRVATKRRRARNLVN